jgi:hypothetical protein
VDTARLRRDLRVWKQLLVISAGVFVLLLAAAVIESSFRQGFSYTAGWLYSWAAFQTLITPPGIVLLLNKHWRKLPLADTLDIAFGYLAVAWGTVFAFGVASRGDDRVLYVVLLVLGGSAMTLALLYWWLRTERTFREGAQ